MTLQQADEPSSSSSSSPSSSSPLPPSLVSLEAERNQSVGPCASGSVAADAQLVECAAKRGVCTDFQTGELPFDACLFRSLA